MQVASLIFTIVFAVPFVLGQAGTTNGIDLEENLSWGTFTGAPGNIGASHRDAFPTAISGRMASYSQVALSKASKYLAQQNEASFNFQSWYQSCLQDFKLKQEKARYRSEEEKEDDFNAFKHKLDTIAAKFSQSQGSRYSKFVQNILKKSWNKVSDDMQRIVKQIREEGEELNNLYVEQSSFYYKLAEIACIRDDQTLVDPTDPTVFAPTSTWRFSFDNDPPTGPFGDWDENYDGAASSNCKLKVIYEKISQAEEDLIDNITPITNTVTQKRILNLKSQWVTTIREWIKCNRDVDVIMRKIEARTQSLQRLQALLGTFSSSPFSGMNGAPGSLVPSSQLTIGVGTLNPSDI